MPLRAIDFHVHLPTPDWLDGSMAGYVEAAEAYFRSPVQRQSLDELAARDRGLGLRAVLLARGAATATGAPRVPAGWRWGGPGGPGPRGGPPGAPGSGRSPWPRPAATARTCSPGS